MRTHLIFEPYQERYVNALDLVTAGNDLTAAHRIIEILDLSDTYSPASIQRRLNNIRTSYERNQSRHPIKRPSLVLEQLEAFSGFCARQIKNGMPDFPERLSRRLRNLHDDTIIQMVWHLAEYRWPNRRYHEIFEPMREELFAVHANDPVTWKRAADDALMSMRSKNWPGRGKARQGTGWANDEALWLIGDFYKDLTSKVPGVGTEGPDGVPFGRFIDFASVCLDHIGCLNKSPNSIRNRLRRIRPDSGW